jgi:hypothetical protein
LLLVMAALWVAWQWVKMLHSGLIRSCGFWTLLLTCRISLQMGVVALLLTMLL